LDADRSTQGKVIHHHVVEGRLEKKFGVRRIEWFVEAEIRVVRDDEVSLSGQLVRAAAERKDARGPRENGRRDR
jgi:hypothetical protein